MNNIRISIIMIICIFSLTYADPLFEIKDASFNTVLEVSSDGLRIFNQGDTLMVISSSEIKAYIEGDPSKALSRSFSVTSTSSGKGIRKAFEVEVDSTKIGTVSTTMGTGSDLYTDFSRENIFLGENSGQKSRPGQVEPYYGKDNTFIGNKAGYSNTYGFGNIFIGYEAGYFSTTSNQNISIGYQSGYNMTGQSNTLVGYFAGKGSGSGGDYNSFFGRAAGFSIGNAASNTLIGGGSGSALVNGSGNTLIGKDAGKGQSGAGFSYNTVLGYASGTQLSTGGFNVIIGYNAGYSLATGTGNIFIGKQAGGAETGSDKLYIDNSNTTTPLIHGDFATDILTVNGTLKVKTIEIADMTDTSLGIDGDIIQYSTTSAYDLGNNVAGEHWDDVCATSFTNFSDIKTKKNVNDINFGLSDVLKLRPVSFQYRKEIDNDDRVRFGLIAQEVEKIIPNIVIDEDVDADPITGEKIVKKNDLKAMNYIDLIPVLIKSIQEQQVMIDELKKEVAELKSR